MLKDANGTEKSIVSEADPRTVKRAQWEAFEFDLEAPGLVQVINGSHENPKDHFYRVNVESGKPVACECNAFQYGDGPCKHMVAVAIREPVLKAAQSVPVTDGGRDVNACKNGQKNCCGPQGEELPCFECFKEASQ